MADLQLYYDDISQQPEVVIDGEFEYVNITSLSVSPPLHYVGGVLTIDVATATNSGILSATDWSNFNSKEPAITAGTALQYWRGDKTWQILDTSAVPENTYLYFTTSRARGAVSASSPLSYDNLTGIFSIPLASSSSSGYLSSADWIAFNSKEPAISLGTTLQYWRGDKTWQTLNTGVVPENTNLYFTNIRAIGATLTGYAATSGSITSADTILSAIEKLGYDKHVPVTIPVNSGLTLTNQLISMGTPGTCTPSTLNAVSGGSHTHAITGFSGGTKSFFFPAESASAYNNRRVRSIAGAGAFNFNFVVPKDFVSLVGVYIVCFIAPAAAGSGKNIDFIVEYTNSVGNLYNQHTASDLTSTYDLTGYGDRLYEFNLTSLFSSLTANTNGGIRMDNNSIGGSIYTIGIRIEYT